MLGEKDLVCIKVGDNNPFTVTSFINGFIELVRILAYRARVYPKGTLKIVGNEYVLDLTEASNDPNEGEGEGEGDIATLNLDDFELITITYCDTEGVSQTRQVLVLKE